jgi:hypothetical protein
MRQPAPHHRKHTLQHIIILRDLSIPYPCLKVHLHEIFLFRFFALIKHT